jgi:hypothetical protein
MIRLFRFIITGSWHMHKWIPVNMVTIIDSRNKPVGHEYIRKCEVCGAIKRFR